MVIGYIYQFDDGSLHQVNMKAASKKYIKQVTDVFGKEEKIFCRWLIKHKR